MQYIRGSCRRAREIYIQIEGLGTDQGEEASVDKICTDYTSWSTLDGL